jgi:hypothetical protein
MPIAPTFNPTTGASGGASAPAAGGDDLNAVTWTDVDLTDGSWTETDPDSLASSVSIAAGVNKVTLAELAVGSINYNWTSGSTHRAPRYHKLLVPDGDQIGSDDFFFLLWRLRHGYQRLGRPPGIPGQRERGVWNVDQHVGSHLQQPLHCHVPWVVPICCYSGLCWVLCCSRCE